MSPALNAFAEEANEFVDSQDFILISPDTKFP